MRHPDEGGHGGKKDEGKNHEGKSDDEKDDQFWIAFGENETRLSMTMRDLFLTTTLSEPSKTTGGQARKFPARCDHESRPGHPPGSILSRQ